MKEIEEYSWQEIESLPKKEKLELSKRFLQAKKEMTSCSFLESEWQNIFDEHLSLYENYLKLQNYIVELQSEIIFPGHIVKLYPYISESIAQRDIIAHLGPYIIQTGTRYCRYRPLIKDYTSKKCYVLKKAILTTHEYTTLLPHTFREFETWDKNLETSFFKRENTPIDFYDLSCRLKTDKLALQELKKSRK